MSASHADMDGNLQYLPPTLKRTGPAPRSLEYVCSPDTCMAYVDSVSKHAETQVHPTHRF